MQTQKCIVSVVEGSNDDKLLDRLAHAPRPRVKRIPVDLPGYRYYRMPEKWLGRAPQGLTETKKSRPEAATSRAAKNN